MTTTTSPTTNTSTTMDNEAFTAASLTAARRRASLKFIFSPNNTRPQPSTTNKIILDYLLYLSIQSRLKQSQLEVLELSTPLLQEKDQDAIQLRKERWLTTAKKAEQDKNAVESIVTGILSSHRNKKPSFQMDRQFEQRLHLCQLTNLIFGRLNTTNYYDHSIHNKKEQDGQDEDLQQQHKQRRILRHEHHLTEEEKEKEHLSLWQEKVNQGFCRRHRLQTCFTCCHHKTSSNKNNKTDHASSSPPGLMEAIPTFLKTSADWLRQTLENQQHNDSTTSSSSLHDKPLIFAGQKVMGGGMPPRWYDLFLDVLTQAAIECYLCDGQTGLESIYEIFSYGDVEDDEEDDYSTLQQQQNVNKSASLSSQQELTPPSSTIRDDGGDEEEEDEEEEEEDEDNIENDWGIKAADHHLLFPKTRTMFLFKTQVREREKEFLIVDKNDTLLQHFEKLAKRYPLEHFEKNIGEFIQMIHHSMAVPTLDKYEGNNNQSSINNDGNSDNADHNNNNNNNNNVNVPSSSSSATSSSSPTSSTIFKYPGDGSLLMPEIPDDEDEEQVAMELHNGSNNIVQDTSASSSPSSNKRKASDGLLLNDDAKKQKQE
ncbi:hypothetical protein BJ944DRAFT_269999 [Cunninghamella echinulata]|nr:hypothetical protein BJ944DRAFT_269999 [Cunninghamella echinulata]